MNTDHLYERVSSRGQNLDAQHPDLLAFGQRRQTEGREVRHYEPDYFTGKEMSRPSFNQILKNLRRGDALVVWRIDRLGRTTRGLVNLFGELKEMGVAFISIRDGIDTSTESITQNLIMNILASIAQFETEIRSDRIASAIEAKRARGEKWKGGRPAGTCNKLTPEVRDTIASMREDGKSISAIARVLKLARNSVYSALKEKVA